MSDLGTALRELARDADAPGVDVSELWVRGRRRVLRRRLVAGAAAAVLVVGTGLAGLAAPSRTVVMPAVAPHAPALPMNVYLPDPRLAGTADAGPIGPLAVLGTAERDFGDFVSSSGVFGISATTGAYRFLDLPDQVLGTSVVLSPDGRRLAYWTSGPTTGKAYDDAAAPGTPSHVGGFAIYDTEDGSVARAPFASEHGLSEQVPFWVDSRTVAFEVWHKTTRTAAKKVNSYFWTGTGSPRVTATDLADISSLQRNRDGSLLTPRPSYGYDVVRPADDGFHHTPGERLVFARTAEGARSGYNTVSRSGRLVAAIPIDTPDVTAPLMAGTIGADGTVPSLRRTGNLQAVRLLGWRDATTVLVTGSQYRGDASLYAVDLATGAVDKLGNVNGELLISDSYLAVATDLVPEPMVHGRRPPEPPDRSWLWPAAGGAAVGFVALLLWRRRRG